MSLLSLQDDMMSCSRCSSCKWVPYNRQQSWRFSKNCPSVTYYNFHSYAGSGKMILANSLLQERVELDESVADIVFKCNMCGACAASCKNYRDDIDLDEVLLELRAHCAQEGYSVPENLAMLESMKKFDNTLGEPKEKRGDWADGLNVKDVSKEKVDVLFHTGCRFSYDEGLVETVRGAIKLMQTAGISVGIAGAQESCCGGRAYELGFFGETGKYADDMISRIKASGATLVVTACADCFAHFNYTYSRIGKDLPVPVKHITQFLEELIANGMLELKHQVSLRTTYHDPCHLGRMSEPYKGDWAGNKLNRPSGMKRQGWYGVYDTPRGILKSIPGVKFSEMERIREWAWCCGAGGGVMDSYPEFAQFTANERIEEALSTGAQALVTSCPWCERMFKDAIQESGADIKVFDLVDLVLQSAGV